MQTQGAIPESPSLSVDRNSRRHLIQASLLTVVIVAGLGVLFAVNPIRAWYFPACQFHALTGLHCPGCGMTRATYELLHGHLLVALHLNALFVLALPVTGGVLAARAFAQHQGRALPSGLQRPWVLWALLGVVILFGIARNIPIYPFTLLAP